MKNSRPVCHDCHSHDVHSFPAYSSLARVTSDCKPWRAGGSLQLCRSCGLIQANTNDHWKKECGEIYASYESNYQSGGIDQAIFDPTTGAAVQRSEKLLLELCRRGLVPAAGSLVDIGCGSGGFLRACSKHLPGWDLFGLESATKYEKEVRGIPGVRNFFPVGFEELEGKYDLITMLHVFEHLDAPSAAYTVLQKALDKKGLIFIQAPSCEANPFELLVADHASHFTANQVVRMLQSMKVPILSDTNCDWIPKEISIVAGMSDHGAKLVRNAGEIEAIIKLVEKQLAWLESVTREAKRVVKSAAPFGIFGTSIAANWLTGVVGEDAIAFYVDEDPGRTGREHFGKPILAPNQVGPYAKVYVPMAPVVGKAVANRLAGAGLDLVLP